MDQLNSPNSHNPNLEYVFVDTSVNDYQYLIDGITPSNPDGQMMVVTFDQSVDGIQQISETLSQYAQEIAAVHIVAHGDAGMVQLGNSSLNGSNLSQYQNQLSTWGSALTAEGDILFYGCNVAQGEVGQQFVDELTGMTGADIAASDDLTGNAALGGDWNLEVETGSIEADLVFDLETQASYEHTLATLNLGDNGGTDADGNEIKWGKTINDATINVLDFSGVKSNLTIKVLSDNSVEITRSSGSPNKITASLDYVTEIRGTKASLKDTDLDLSAITSDTTVTITSKDVVEVNYALKNVKFKGIRNLTGAKGDTNLYKVEDGGNIKGDLIAKGTNNTLEYLGNESVDVFLSDNFLDSAAQGFRNISGITEVIGSNKSDTISLASNKAINLIEGGGGADDIEGSSGKDNISGGEGNDLIKGFAGEDIINGGAGNDTIDGGADTVTDLIDGGLGDDTYQFRNNWGFDVVKDTDGNNTLDFSQVTQALTVDVGALTENGIKVVSGNNKVVRDAQNNGVQNITELIQGTEAVTYNFKADFVNNIGDTALKINALNTASNLTKLDFSDIPATKDLLFEIDLDAKLRRVGGSTQDITRIKISKFNLVEGQVNQFLGVPTLEYRDKQLIAIVYLDHRIANSNNTFIIGGKGNNVYKIIGQTTDNNKLGKYNFQGAIQGGTNAQDLTTKRNILDYSDFSGNATEDTSGSNIDLGAGTAFKLEGTAIPGMNGRVIARINRVISPDTSSRVEVDLIGSTTANYTEELIAKGNVDTIMKFGDGSSFLQGSEQTRTITGGEGVDRIDGTHLSERGEPIKSGAGNDQILASWAAEVEAGADHDVIRVEISENDTELYIRQTRNRERLVGTGIKDGQEGHDQIFGSRFEEVLFGNNGDDTIRGGGGNDRIKGGNGNDSLQGGSGRDIYVFEENWGIDQIVDEEGEGNVLDFSNFTLRDENLTFELDNGQIEVHSSRGDQLTASNIDRLHLVENLDRLINNNLIFRDWKGELYIDGMNTSIIDFTNVENALSIEYQVVEGEGYSANYITVRMFDNVKRSLFPVTEIRLDFVDKATIKVKSIEQITELKLTGFDYQGEVKYYPGQVLDSNGNVIFDGSANNLETTELIDNNGENIIGSIPQILTLTTGQLTPLIAEAQNRWQEAGYNIENLENVAFEIVDLPANLIGQTDGYTITLDQNAARYGWFIDNSPEEDSEFNQYGIAIEGEGATGDIDLLSTIMHEIGHVLGVSHNSQPLMNETLETGVRLNPEQWTGETPFIGTPISGTLEATSSDIDALGGLLTSLATWSTNFNNTITNIQGNAVIIPFVNAPRGKF